MDAIQLAVRATADANRQQNTDPRHARVYYPFHPLAGQRLLIRERRRGPPATYYLVTAAGEGFSVPVWMTEPAAAEVERREWPQVHVRALLEILSLTKGLESTGLHEESLPSDQAKESSREDRPTPTAIDTRPASASTASADRRSKKERGADRQDGAASRRQRPEDRGSGGPR